MINDKPTPPKVVHRDTKQDTQKFLNVLTEFTKQMEITFAKNQLKGKTGWDNPEMLLQLRKDLVRNIKEGMLERKNQELDISLLSMFVWFNRLDEEARARILNEWG